VTSLADRPKLLDRIVAAKRKELLAKQAQQPLEVVRVRAEQQTPALSLVAGMSERGPHLIAEIAEGSPMRGPYDLREDVGVLARKFADSGVLGISVVTESRYFGGGITDLIAVRRAVTCPVIRRDFVVHPYQVYESRAYGADAIFLLAPLLTAAQMTELMEVTFELGMEPIVEVHTEEDLERVQSLRPALLCLNNWNLEDFSLHPGKALQLIPGVRSETMAIASGNITGHREAAELFTAGARCILVGAALITADDPQAKVNEILKGTV
jgi:indole-3-glycerol phosphate synthase